MSRTNIQPGITEGVIWKQLLAFFFPILLGTLFQQLYNTVDAIIVGQFLGKAALAAVGGGTGTAINLLIGFFTGLSTGATVMISQYSGAKNGERVSKAVHTAVALAIAGGLCISVVGYIFTSTLLNLIGTPSDILPLAVTYMHIYFMGSLAIVLYNMGSGIFRALGDSKRPFHFLVISCLVNIALDLLFVGALGFGVEGAAYATVLSQALSVALVYGALMRQPEPARLSIVKIGFDPAILGRTLSIGLPAGVQSVMYTVSNLIIQSSINSFGTDTAAAWAAYSKIDAIFWAVVSSFGVALTTFIGQNYGAGKIDRAKKSVRLTFGLAGSVTLLFMATYLLFGEPALGLFSADKDVIQTGVGIIYCVVPWYFIYLPIEVLSGATRGAGKTFVPTIISVFGICLIRVAWMQIVPRFCGHLNAVLYCYPFTWAVTSAAFFVYYCRGNIWSYHRPKLRH